MRKRLALAVASIATVLLLTSACGAEPEPVASGRTDGGAPEGGGATGGGRATEVVASDFAFSPTRLNLKPGAKVELTLKNEDSATHSFTSDDLDVDIEVEGGASASTSLTAPESGNAEWHCRFHSQMTGEISVGQNGADETEGGQTESEDDGGAY
ncbi:MAG: cupredoxin domain-containing protein [Actinomycetota bacterium]|nr:cupredoxin domain-containing protein [Actinomycetota bacterium]